MEDILKVLSAFRITLPKDFRDKFGIKVGDNVKAVWDGDSLMILPVDLEVKFRMKLTIGQNKEMPKNE